MTEILAVVSHKGRVGKTSLVQNLGFELARQLRRVLLVDLDPQSNLTIGRGLDPGAAQATIYQVTSEPQSIAEARPTSASSPLTR